jgi:hypothetical protein
MYDNKRCRLVNRSAHNSNSKRTDEHAPPRSSPERQKQREVEENKSEMMALFRFQSESGVETMRRAAGVRRKAPKERRGQAIVGQDSGGNRSIKPTATLMHVGEHNRDRLSLPRRVIRSRGGGRWPVTATRRERSRRLAHQPKPVEPSVATPKERTIRGPWESNRWNEMTTGVRRHVRARTTAQPLPVSAPEGVRAAGAGRRHMSGCACVGFRKGSRCSGG